MHWGVQTVSDTMNDKSIYVFYFITSDTFQTEALAEAQQWCSELYIYSMFAALHAPLPTYIYVHCKTKPNS